MNADALIVNAGATLNLNGSAQTFGNLTSSGTLPGAGGFITNTASVATAFQSKLARSKASHSAA